MQSVAFKATDCTTFANRRMQHESAELDDDDER